MSTFYAKSALKVLELFPWISIWFDVNAFANSSMIIRWIRMGSMYFTQLCELDAKEDLKSLRTGGTVHHQLRMTHLWWKTKEDLKSLKTGRTVHHQLRITHLWWKA